MESIRTGIRRVVSSILGIFSVLSGVRFLLLPNLWIISTSNQTVNMTALKEPVTRPYSLWDFRNNLWKPKLAFIQTNMSPKTLYQTLQTTKMKNDRQKAQLKSVSIFLKFDHLFILLFLMCYLNLLLTFERPFLCFTQLGGSFHCLNFYNFQNAASLISKKTIALLHWFSDYYQSLRLITDPRSSLTAT